MFHPTINAEEAIEIIKASQPFKNNRKFVAEDIIEAEGAELLAYLEEKNHLIEAAVRFLEDWDGGASEEDAYLLAMHSVLHKNGNLSEAQWAGVLNWFANILRQSENAVTKTPVPNGYYTVVMDDTHVTLRLKDPWSDCKVAPGTQVIGYLNGSNNTTSYCNIGFVVNGKFKVWKTYRDGYEHIHRAIEFLLTTDWIVAGKEYALRSKKCCFCSHVLTTDISINYGYGPECAEKHNLPWEAVA